VLISPAVIFVTVLVAGPLALAIWLSFTNATTGAAREVGRARQLQRTSGATRIPARGLAHVPLHRHLAGDRARRRRADRPRDAAELPGKWVLRFLILLPWAAPIALSLMAWKWIFDPAYSILTWTLQHLHLVSQVRRPSGSASRPMRRRLVIVVQAWRILPFAVVIFIAGLASIPKEVDDAAAIDGATGFASSGRSRCRCSCRSRRSHCCSDRLHGDGHGRRLHPHPGRAAAVVQHRAGDDVVVQDGDRVGLARPGRVDLAVLLPVLAVVSVVMLLFARRAEVT
jgi:hypothetical protein